MITTNIFTFFLIIFSLTLISLSILYSEKLYSFDAIQPATESLHKHAARTTAQTPRWYRVIARKLMIDRRRKFKIGRVRVANKSFGDHEIFGTHEVEMVDIHYDRVSKDLKWSSLFPEWIDETLPRDSSTCPRIPMPRFEDYDDLDVVVADVSCGEDGVNFRDVTRLQLNLAVANLLVNRRSKDVNGREHVLAVFVGSCGPMLEIFRCEDMLWHEGNSWIYKPDLKRLKQKLLMPVGSCELVPAFPRPRRIGTKAKEAYVSVLHSSEDYVCGAIVLAQSIIKSNSTKDLILLVDDSISGGSLQGLRAAGWKIRQIKRIRSPYAESETYNEWNYSKLRIWQLTEYDKLIFVDSDFLILRNTDEFFVYPQLSAAGNSRHLFNSGFMLVEPSSCTFRHLMKQRFHVSSYNGGDQGFLNEMILWWHRWPAKLNFLKDFNSLPEDYMHENIPSDVYALHYLGFKPWMCHRHDHDCNWDILENKRFASDFAHRTWWRLYESMPKQLRAQCVFTPEMEGRLKMHIAKPANVAIQRSSYSTQ